MRDKECHLEQAYTRLEAGEAPDEQTALEWQREERERGRREQEEYIRRKVQLTFFTHTLMHTSHTHTHSCTHQTHTLMHTSHTHTHSCTHHTHTHTHTHTQLAEEEESHILPGGSLSTAEPRPNAYMPSGEGDLPIPKPYGCHAPFKPSQPGSNIRHIRKPQLKPIDI